MNPDFSEHIPFFISTTLEQFENLNESLLALEKKPNDLQLIDEMFRICHNLKSESSSFEFEDISELAHEMENVLDQLRQEKNIVSSKMVDVFFECMDAITKAMEEISNSDYQQHNYSELIAKLSTITS